MTFPLSALRGTKLYNDLGKELQRSSLLISMEPNLKNGGSGSIVKYKNCCGILTATHVISDKIHQNHIFSPYIKTEDPSEFKNHKIPIKRFVYLESEEGLALLKNHEADWPHEILDICLIELEQDIFDKIIQASGKTAIDLYEHKMKYLEDTYKYDSNDNSSNWCWAINGAPRAEAKHDDNSILVSRYDGIYTSGGYFVVRDLKYVLSGYDDQADLVYSEFGDTKDQLPIKFSGMSGAGLWQVSFAGNGKPETIVEIFFGGIFVAETPRILISNGPSSLYEIFTDFLDKSVKKADLFQPLHGPFHR